MYMLMMPLAWENACGQVAIFFVLFLTGWESDADFANQHRVQESETKANENFFQHSIENLSKIWISLCVFGAF